MAATTTAPVVATRDGIVRGSWRDESAAFLGVPYAKAPVGPLRFAAPVPPASWDGVRDATQYGATPLRADAGGIVPEPSYPGEEILNLNVFTPVPGDDAAALPVLVWIHGGGFFSGSPSSPWYDGASFNRDDVVVVAVSYRLAFDGFGHIDGAPANRGILDQIAALTWVRENIAAFGGDPDRVTIGGQSAGGGSVMHLLAAPAARGLFHGAVAQSAAWADRSLADGETASRALATTLGLDGITLEDFRSASEAAILAASEGLDATAVLGREQVGFPEMLTAGIDAAPLVFVPLTDGEVLHAVADVVGTPPVPLLAGTTANEFTHPGPDADPAQTLDALHNRGLSAQAVAQFQAELHRLGDAFVQGQLLSESMFRAPLARFARSAATTPWGSSTWLYDFRFHPATNAISGHCMDIPFTFDLLDAPGVTALIGDAPQTLADRMHQDWVRFIRGGDCGWNPIAEQPTGAERYDASGGTYDPAAYAFSAALTV